MTHLLRMMILKSMHIFFFFELQMVYIEILLIRYFYIKTQIRNRLVSEECRIPALATKSAAFFVVVTVNILVVMEES